MGQETIIGCVPDLKFLVQWDTLPDGARRTLSIDGDIRNVAIDRAALPSVGGVTAFDHRGHLIAHRFGGPDLPLNLVAMHGRINMRGTPWGEMEEFIARRLGAKGTARMTVTARYEGVASRPHAFWVEVVFQGGERMTWQTYNFAPYLIPRTASEYACAREGDNVSPTRGAYTYLSGRGKAAVPVSVLSQPRGGV